VHPVQVQHRSTKVLLSFLASGQCRSKKIQATRFAGGCRLRSKPDAVDSTDLDSGFCHRLQITSVPRYISHLSEAFQISKTHHFVSIYKDFSRLEFRKFETLRDCRSYRICGVRIRSAYFNPADGGAQRLLPCICGNLDNRST
jgi:hypothetical protein